MAEVKTSTQSDLKKIAECHRSAFPGSLSSAMGISYLVRMIGWYLSGKNRMLFHVEDGGKVIGYCGGMIDDGTESMGSASGMIQFTFNDAVKAIALRPWLLFHSEMHSKYGLIIKNVKRRFGIGKKKTGKSSTAKPGPVAEPLAGLVVIGVAKEFMGRGYGSLLLKEFESRARAAGIKKLGLSVRKENEQAIKSYARNGWVITKENPQSYEMEKNVS